MKHYAILAVIVIIVIVVIAAVAMMNFNKQYQQKSDQPDLKSKCCQQCGNASEQDARGIDISGSPCSYYDTLSSDCSDYFKKNPMSISECKN